MTSGLTAILERFQERHNKQVCRTGLVAYVLNEDAEALPITVLRAMENR